MNRKIMNEENIEITEAILGCIGDGVISTDMEGRIYYMNEAATVITGFSEIEANGKLFDDLLTIFDAVTGKLQESPISRVINSSASIGLKKNAVFKTRDGNIKYLSANCSLLKGKDKIAIGIVLVIRDISSMRNLEFQLITEKDNFEVIFNDAPIGMIIINAENIITKANTSAINWIGKNRECVVGRSHGESISCKWELQSEFECGKTQNCGLCEFKKAITLAIKENKTTFNQEINKQLLVEGKELEVWMKISVSPIDVDGETHSLMTLMDITEMKKVEANLLESEEKYKNLFDNADKANKAKSEFLAHMSHEIRTPINGMLGMVELTLQTDLQREQRENLDLAMTCANNLLIIINDILDFSKMEAGKLSIENKNFRIVNLVDEIIRAHMPQVIQKGLELNYMISRAVPEYIYGDSNRLRQVISNLISNAVKFTESGEITTIIKNNSAEEGHVELEFSVEDTGIGIAEEYMEKLFKSFSQVDSSFTKRYGGTGLGLAITKQLVELMGGTIWVKSEKGKGSTFYFKINFENENKELLVRKEKRSIQVPIKPMDILVVEDDVVNKLVFCKMINQKGHRVEIASNGEEALKVLLNKRFDIIFMDIQMPLMDGITTTKIIREKEGKLSHTPIIALTAHGMKGDREKYLSVGMDEYLSKPILMEELFLILDKFSCEESYWNDLTLNEVKINENGEVVIVSNDKNHNISLKENEEFELYFKEIEKLTFIENYAGIEKNAFKINALAESLNNEDYKIAALKIKFAARRKDRDEVINVLKALMKV